MSSQVIEWLIVLLFFVLFLATILGEIFWLAGKKWTTTGKATAFVLITDSLSFGIGSAMVFIIFGIMIVMVFGPAGTGGSSPGGAYVALTVVAAILPVILLILIKRLFLLIFKIKGGAVAWGYSVLVAFLKLIVTLVPPSIASYAALYLF